MNVSRRVFLKSGGVAMIGMSTIPAFLQRAVAATPMPNKKKLIVLFQRGAADGLNIVVPFGEAKLLPHPPDHRDSAAAAGRRRRGGRSRRLLRPASESRASRAHYSTTDSWPSFTPRDRPIRRVRISTRRISWSPARPASKSTDDGWLNRTVQGSASRTHRPISRSGHGAESSAYFARLGARRSPLPM